MRNKLLSLFALIFMLASCQLAKSPIEIASQTTRSIDTIGSITYRQSLVRGITSGFEEPIPSIRDFYYEQLAGDSVIGAKAHIYYYDSNFVVIHEDIYDGNRLIRTLKKDTTALVFDLLKYPEFRKKTFWSKLTPYTIRYMLNYAMQHKDHYKIVLGNDTTISGVVCYSLRTILEGGALIPGMNKMTLDTNRTETMYLFINKKNLYPQMVRMEIVFHSNPDKVYYSNHLFSNIRFNPILNDTLFNTSDEVTKGYKITERKPY
jgi:hypothetical protein